MTNANMSANKFARLLSVQPSAVSHILSGRNKPGYDFICSLINHFPQYNPEWILIGTGEMYKDIEDKILPVNNLNDAISDGSAHDNNPDESSKPIDRIGCLNQQTQLAATQPSKPVSKIIVLFNDGSFQELT